MTAEPLPAPAGMTKEQFEDMTVHDGEWRKSAKFVCAKCGQPALYHPYTNKIWGCGKCDYTTYSVSMCFKPVTGSAPESSESSLVDRYTDDIIERAEHVARQFMRFHWRPMSVFAEMPVDRESQWIILDREGYDRHWAAVRARIDRIKDGLPEPEPAAT